MSAPSVPLGRHGPVVPLAAVTVLELIDRCVAAGPHRPAVVEAGRLMTYAELDRAADAVAHRLRAEHGIGVGDIVLVAAHAGIEFTCAVLGIMRAGAAYLPVDLSYPSSRLDYILNSSDASLQVLGNVTAAGDIPAVPLDELVRAPYPIEAVPRPELGPDDLAYVIFSSGSTGRPKGILQTHRCLVNFVSWQVHASGLGTRRRVLQAAALSFDVSVQEIFSTLASSGCLLVPDADTRRDARALVGFLIEHAAEVVDFPQSLIDLVLTLPVSFRDAPALRHVISAGETVRITPALRELLAARPDITVHNHYGPAENHMVLSHSMSVARRNLEDRPPVGAPVWNTYVRLLDADQRPVPDGEVGEIYIGGVGIARGYTDPELSATVFLPDPFAPGARLYRTRDRGRWRADGTLDLLGRIDDLIKIRGYSVEPREVEAALAEVPGVAEAAVFGREHDGETRLHAVLTGTPPGARELRGLLLARLPEYMAPTHWWIGEAMPISPNGKLDRTALPGPGARPLPEELPR